jgi:hypothetical protein
LLSLLLLYLLPSQVESRGTRAYPREFSIISTKWGKPSRRVYAPNHVGKLIHQIQDPWEEAVVLHKKDNGYSAITCTIYYPKIKNALCDLGASVKLLSKAMFEEYDTLLSLRQ